MKFPFGCKMFWSNKELDTTSNVNGEGSFVGWTTTCKKVESVRLQKIGAWILVWAQLEKDGDEELIHRFRDMDIWDLKKKIEDAEIKVSCIHLSSPEEEPYVFEEWKFRGHHTVGVNEYFNGISGLRSPDNVLEKIVLQYEKIIP